MIEHLVLIRWKAEAMPEAIDAVLLKAAELRSIDGVAAIDVRANLGLANAARTKGIAHVLRVMLHDNDALDRFGPAPAHRAFAGEMLPLTDDVTIVDLPA